MKVTLVAMTPNGMQVCEEAACECYQSEPTRDGRIMKACYRSGHHSVLEHCSFTWKIEGISRACLAQLTRHRVGASFSVKSQRYCDESGFGIVTPATIENNPLALDCYNNVMESITKAYEQLRLLDIPAEDARMVLPNACTTSLTLTMNLRELIHFCNERMCTRAQWEIRELARKMANAVNEATDNAFATMLVPKCEKNKKYPFCPEAKAKSCGRHKTLAELMEREA